MNRPTVSQLGTPDGGMEYPAKPSSPGKEGEKEEERLGPFLSSSHVADLQLSAFRSEDPIGFGSWRGKELCVSFEIDFGRSERSAQEGEVGPLLSSGLRLCSRLRD